MLSETRRRATLTAMQVECWLPRTRLPFAAPSRADMLEPSKKRQRLAAKTNVKVAQRQVSQVKPAVRRENTDKVRSQFAAQPAPVKQPSSVKLKRTAAPRFSLQLLRAGDCLLLMDCPYGEFLQSREPAYLLLVDLLRAAQLAPVLKPVGEPVNWPLLASQAIAQDADAARDYVQHFIRAQLEVQPCACLWLLGAQALRFAADNETSVFRELYIDGLCNAWVLPTLDELLTRPAVKRELWHAMRRVLSRWKSND